MKYIKQVFKRNTRNLFFKALDGLGRSFHKLYENRNHDIYSNGEANLLKKIGTLNPKIIFDVGANVGEYALLVSKYCPTATIYSFEPVQGTYDILREATENHKQIKTFKNGFYKEKSTQIINLYDSNAHSSLFDVTGEDATAERRETIDLVAGDDFVLEHGIENIDFLKLDVEGTEMNAMIGLKKSLEQKRIRMVQFEYGTINIVTRKLLIDFYAFFKQHGYIVGKLYPKRVAFREYNFKHEDFVGPNFIAIHQSDEELKALLG